jgi:hypothetical protein
MTKLPTITGEELIAALDRKSRFLYSQTKGKSFKNET